MYTPMRKQSPTLVLTMLMLSRLSAFQTKIIRPALLRAHWSSSSSALGLAEDDHNYMMQAVECAKLGFGHTFPNPAVGCVLVQANSIIGQGFHPRAGYPHAEIFALFQASGHVSDGVVAALSVLEQGPDLELVQTLTKRYSAPEGPEQLFGRLFAEQDDPVTAYVTLEPCCHRGQTPPCAASLVSAGVNRVVVGVRDPNPRVDGGGVQLLEDAGIQVDFLPQQRNKEARACRDLVTNFCQRITPRDDVWPSDCYNELVSGAMRRKLRAQAGRLKQDGQLAQVSWGEGSVDHVEDVSLKPEWMEHLDAVLWDKELVLIRLNGAVAKKKEAKALGSLIADQLQAHVAQTLGHTCLLYRPAAKPVLDLESLVEEAKSN